MKALVSWSGGKDSALALHRARLVPGLQIVGLLTTLSREFDRVSMHGVRRSLLEAQADALGLPVYQVLLPTPPPDAACALSARPNADGFTAFPSNDTYESALLDALHRARSRGIEAVVFGDIYLQDLRAYRERLLADAGLQGIFPLWHLDTRELLRDFIDDHFQAVVVCVESSKLDASWLGRPLDDSFLRNLPPHVDPCGENGEFHTFVHSGPIFIHAIPFTPGASVHREPFCFLDLDLVGYAMKA